MYSSIIFTILAYFYIPPKSSFAKKRDVLSFSFTIIKFSLDISFRVVMQYTFIVYFLWVESLDISFRVIMQHTSPLEKGRKRGDYLYRTDAVY